MLLGAGVEETPLKCQLKVPYSSIMADECTDVSDVEEFSIYCSWIENGEATEHFINIVPLKNADAENIHLQLKDCLKKKNILVSNLIGMDFDVAGTFAVKKSDVEARIKTFPTFFVCSVLHCY